MGSGATGPSDWLWTLDHAKCVRTYVAGTVLAQVTASLSSVCKTASSAYVRSNQAFAASGAARDGGGAVASRQLLPLTDCHLN